jgi:hypothetical protein
MADRWNEDFLVEIRAHSLDDLVIEEAIGLRLATEDAPLASAASFNFGFESRPVVWCRREVAGLPGGE